MFFYHTLFYYNHTTFKSSSYSLCFIFAFSSLRPLYIFITCFHYILFHHTNTSIHLLVYKSRHILVILSKHFITHIIISDFLLRQFLIILEYHYDFSSKSFNHNISFSFITDHLIMSNYTCFIVQHVCFISFTILSHVS